MKNTADHFEKNRKAWNKKTDIHIHSEFYDNENFIKGKSSLKHIETKLLGDINGKSILHLQCHFGQDTISLARAGAEVTGVDFSDNAVRKAEELSEATKTSAEFICSGIYELKQKLDRKFDIVYTSYGVIGWLPDLGKWAEIISHFLKPEGKFVMVEFHQMLWMFDDDFKYFKYDYFNKGEIEETVKGTYADRKAAISYEFVNWNHSLSEVINNLIKNGLTINSFEEYDYSVYDCFNNAEEFEPGKFRVKDIKISIPMMFSLTAGKI
ncbi:MAG: class I SAM-dependent methyltransferase [Bacteroidetes bacterium]|nr:class I SAM-dependent methyltransferase [Bacteroidota bacterium]